MGVSFFRFLKDLFHLLPGKPKADWTELRSLLHRRPTVVLVPGFGANHRTLSIIRKRLLKDGFNVLILPFDWQTLSECKRGLYQLAERLDSVIFQLKSAMDNPRVFLVAHSTGGLVARYYVQHLGGAAHCEGLITLATPHRGTWIALLGFVSHLLLTPRCLWQMLPFSNFLKILNRSSFPTGFRMVSIYSNDDLLCSPRSTRLPPILNDKASIQSVELNSLSHSDFLLRKETYQVMVNHLRTFSVTKKSA